jgi:hypothetical protein
MNEVLESAEPALKALGEHVQRIEQHVLVSTQRLIFTDLAAKGLIEAFQSSYRIIEEAIRKTQYIVPGYYPLPELRIIERVPELARDSRATELRAKLRACPPGESSWKEFQNICGEILTYTLVPPLLQPKEEISTSNGRQRRDLIFHMPYNASNFWTWIMLTFKAVALIVECKNYSQELQADELTITSKYLDDTRLGLFGIIVSRKGYSESARDEQKRLWINDNKMILSLTDEDLVKMLRLKQAREDPAKVIDNAHRLFREAI